MILKGALDEIQAFIASEKDGKNTHCAYSIFLPDDVVRIAEERNVGLSEEQVNDILDTIEPSNEFGICDETIRVMIMECKNLINEHAD